MKKVICTLLVITLCCPLFACSSSLTDSEIQSIKNDETNGFQPLLPEYAQDLLPQLLTPMDSVNKSMDWTVDQFEPCQGTHLQYMGDPVEFYGQEMVLYLSPAVLPSEEERESMGGLFDFTDLPISKDETHNYLQRFAYVSLFHGEDAISKACEFMSVLDSNFRALYGSPDETAQHAYANQDPKVFFGDMENDTLNPDKHYLSDIWDITPTDIHGIQYSLIVSTVQYLDEQNEPVYRVAISYECKMRPLV